MFKNISSKVRNSTVCFLLQRYSSTNNSKVFSVENHEIKSAIDIEDNLFGNSLKNSISIPKIKTHHKPSSIPRNTNARPVVHLKPKTTPMINKDLPGLQIIRLKDNDTSIVNLLAKVRTEKRNTRNYIIVEGRRLILEALQCDLKLQTLLFTETKELEKIKTEISSAQEQSLVEIYKVPHHVLKTWSTTMTSPGLLAIFNRPDVSIQNQKKDSFPISVVCDNVRNPNNLGSIIRTCATIPCHQTILTKGCCDPWESKTLRSGCGGQFRINIRDNIEWPNLQQWIPEKMIDCRIFIAENNKDNICGFSFKNVRYDKEIFKSYTEINDLKSHIILIMGGETHGVSKKAYEFLDNSDCKGTFLHIPVAEGTDSLNVNSAAAMILFELRKHLTSSQI